jgi:two-component system OmpR family sensor kinase
VIRRKLVAAIVGLLAVVLAVAGFLVVGSLRDRLVANVDEQLQTRVDDLAHRPERLAGLAPPAFGGFGGGPFAEQRAAFVRLDADGQVQSSLASGRAEDPEPLPDVAGLKVRSKPVTVGSVGAGGPRYRVLGVPLGDGTLFAGVSLADVDRTVDSAIHVLLFGGLAALLAAAAVVWFTVRHGLRPIDAMIGTAQHIADGDLTERATVPDPSSEVGHLGTALNTMLDRIEEAVDAKSASEARLRRFVADASHELRTPLTSIRGYAELYRQDPGSVAQGMARIEGEATRMGELVEDLLLLARLDQGLALRAEPVDLSALAAEAVAAAHVGAPGRLIELDAPAPVVVPGDPGRLRQALDNLLANAREHTPASAPVEVQVRLDEAVARLDVVDHGPGMTEEEVARAFERFWQGEATIDHPRKGTGLGLAIVHDLVQSHGGTVTLDATPGRGLRVRVALPAVGGNSQGTTRPVADVGVTVDEQDHEPREIPT